MAASALELRPRSAVGLMDASLRLCARTSGVWALTLPGLTALTAALFHLIQEAQRNADVGVPALWLGVAWLFRCFCQGAACHQLQASLLDPAPPSIWASYKAALKRAPSLLFVATWLTLLHWMLLVFSMGLAFFFTGSTAVLWAVAMQRRGPLWKLPYEANAMLGPSRAKAMTIRGLFAVQLLAGINLHGGFLLLLYLLRKLLGIDLTWLERFAALDNPSWVTLLVVVTFGLFEPLRAASATLLLLDARVRREGMDLTARLGQLPVRATRSAARVAALLPAVVLAALLFGTGAAQAGPQSQSQGPRPTGTHDVDVAGAPDALPAPVTQLPGDFESPGARLDELAAECESEPLQVDELALLDSVHTSERPHLLRWVSGLERLIDEEDDCEQAMLQLRSGLGLLQAEPAFPTAPEVKAQASAILAQEEFAPPLPERVVADEPEEASSSVSWWQRWVEWWEALLKKLKDSEEEDEAPRERPTAQLPVGGGDVATALIVLLVLGALVVLVYLLLQGRRRNGKMPGPAGMDGPVPVSLSLEAPLESALARPPDAWVALGDALAAQGRHREAVRSVYLALLSGLHARGAIRYDPHVSNWDYLRGFRGPSQHLRPFRELTRRFDFAWYGLDAVSVGAWEDFRRLAVPLLAPGPGEARDA